MTNRMLSLKDDIRGCKACELHKVGGGPVPFHGVPSDVMVLGEAPGREEDKRGVPFCGPAGDLLWHELEEVGIERDTVLVANTVSCFPKRTPVTPNEDEIDACRRNLVAQIRYCDPTYVLALGRVANGALAQFQPLARCHGEWYQFRIHGPTQNLRVFPTYHPSAILHNGTLTRAWRGDLRAFARVVLGNGENEETEGLRT